MQSSPFAVAHDTTGLGTSPRFVCARNIGLSSNPLRMPYLNPLARSVSSIGSLGNLSSPATYPLHPSRRIDSSLGSRYNRTPPDPYGPMALTPWGHTPHSLPTLFVTREHMLGLHMTLLEWLILRNPLDLWTMGCPHQRILSPQGTCIGPYAFLSVATVILLPKGRSRLVPCPPRGASHTPPELGTDLAETSPHPKPLPEDARVQGTG
jgi:hypothetical protein